MTSPTSDVGLPVTELRIDVAHHLEHHASLQLLGFGIERQVVHVVAIDASESECESDVLHRDFDVLRREHFEIGGTDDCSSSRREWRYPPPTAASTTAATTTSRDNKSASSPGQIIDNLRNLFVSQSRTLVLHASDCGGPRVFVPHFVLDAIERVARGADSGHQVYRCSIGTGRSLSRGIGHRRCLRQNYGRNKQNGCGNTQEVLLHGRNHTQMAAQEKRVEPQKTPLKVSDFLSA